LKPKKSIIVMKNELKIGEIVQVDNIKLQCVVSQDGSCTGCHWLVDEVCVRHPPMGSCSRYRRLDDKDVIFAKVVEVQDE
jgi:hypothetical protein